MPEITRRCSQYYIITSLVAEYCIEHIDAWEHGDAWEFIWADDWLEAWYSNPP